MSANILSQEEREQFNRVPSMISDEELVRFFTLPIEYLEMVNQRASPMHQLNQAAHICVLRWLGWSPSNMDQLPRAALVALCEQLKLSVSDGSWEILSERANRSHAQRARDYLGWSKLTADGRKELIEWLKPQAAEHGNSRALLNALLQRLYQQKIVRPGISSLERLVESVQTVTREDIEKTINSQLTREQKKQLDDLLVVPAGETYSPLQSLKETPSKNNGIQLLIVLEKIELIRALGLDKLDLSQRDATQSGVHPNRVKLLAQRAKRRKHWAGERLRFEQRYTLLVCFLNQVLPSLIDQAIQIHSATIRQLFQRAEKRRNDRVLSYGKSLNAKVLLLRQLAGLILDEEGIPDAQLRQAVYSYISREDLTKTVLECNEIAQPADYASFTFVVGAYSYLRRFGPHFLRALHFEAESEHNPLLKAIAFMKAVDDGERTFDKDTPLDFVPWHWKSYVVGEKGEGVDHRMYQFCLHDCLAKALERGELWVSNSQAYTSFRSDWISDEDWPAARKAFLDEYPDLKDVEAFLEQAKELLDTKMAQANQVWPKLKDQVWIEDGKLHLARLRADELPPGTTQLQERLARLLPRIGVAQLLLEVNHWIELDQCFTSLRDKERPVKNSTEKKVAVLMSEGLNIGLQDMSHCVPSMSYRDLAGTYDRYIREDNLHRANVAVVNFYHQLPITRYWGDGTASSSDGQLFGVPVNTIYSQRHPKAPGKNRCALCLYFHVSDHGILFYGQVIHHLSQEGAHALDGILYHETDLTPVRHFVDTGGYQDALWGTCYLLGILLEPRIRDIGDMRLFRLRRRVDRYGHIHSLFSAPINTRVIRENWDDVLRLMASIRSGVVPASRVLGKLNTYHVETGLYKALREIGRIAKTAFLLDYFTKQEVRRRVQVGLNRQESVHSLVRELFLGKRGEFRLRDLDAQIHRAGCLQLVTAMITTWNAAYLSAAVDKLKSEGATVTDEQLVHILPFASEHINLLGRYEFNAGVSSVQTDINSLPLRSMNLVIQQLGLGV